MEQNGAGAEEDLQKRNASAMFGDASRQYAWL